MLKSKILVIGPLKTPFKSGVTNALNLTLNILKKNFLLIKLSTSENVNSKNVRKIRLKRIYSTIKLFLKILKYINKVDIIYYIGSLSYIGFVRDCLIIIISKLYKKKIFIHLHGGNFKENSEKSWANF